jgi:7,8-dihydroneopterin aldolase/epimerase/oxygenase
VHEEEKVLGGEYEVNADLFFSEGEGIINRLEKTIDYTAAYRLIKQRMQLPTPLLETIAMELAEKLKAAFPVTTEITIRIKKINPPVTAFTGNVEVSFTKKYP